MFATIAFGHGAASSPSIIISIIIITSPSPRNAEQGGPPLGGRMRLQTNHHFARFFFFALPTTVPPPEPIPNEDQCGGRRKHSLVHKHTHAHHFPPTQGAHTTPPRTAERTVFFPFFCALPLRFSRLLFLVFLYIFCSSSFCFTHTHAHTRRFALPEFTSTVLRMLPGRGRPVRPGGWWPFSTGRLTSAPEPYGFCGYAAPLSTVAGRAAFLHCQGAATQQRNA